MRTAAALALSAALASACATRSPLHPRASEELRRGYAYLAEEDLERAEVAFEHALAFDPDLPEALNGLGVVARSAGDLELARRRFERAVRLDPDFAEGRANLGESLLAADRHGEAEGELRAALRIDPDLADARQNLARALLLRGLSAPDRRERWASARREYLHLLESEPERAAAHHDLAFMDWEDGRVERAEKGYRRATELAPRSHEAFLGLCNALVRLDRCAEAARACERCLELAPGAERCRVSLRAALACR
jgi:tetratricopeptide (TPR) repeat protein